MLLVAARSVKMLLRAITKASCIPAASADAKKHRMQLSQLLPKAKEAIAAHFPTFFQKKMENPTAQVCDSFECASLPPPLLRSSGS